MPLLCDHSFLFKIRHESVTCPRGDQVAHNYAKAARHRSLWSVMNTHRKHCRKRLERRER